MDKEDVIAKSNFSMLKGKVHWRILQAIKSMGFEKPTRIQALTLPYLLLNKDLIGQAKTGSGKTLAFLIPIVDRLLKLNFDRNHGIGCIIITPTRELAFQISEVLKQIICNTDLTQCLVLGGVKKTKDALSIKRGVNIIVATPGRLLDHLENTEGFQYLLKNLKCLIMDEADKLLEAGFERHITGILKLIPKNRQTVLFSATIDEQIKNLTKLAMNNPVSISMKDEIQKTVNGLKQGYCICPAEFRMCWLYHMLKKTRKLKVMVFFSSCKSVDFHYEFFSSNGKTTLFSIHGQQSQSRRKQTFQSFVAASRGALFCTDVAARGLDIPNVNWIVQYDPPTDPKEYIHRVGRTARGLDGHGSAVIVLRTEEQGFIEYLKREKVFLDTYSFGDPPLDIQEMIQNLIQENGLMRTLARKAYLSYLRCYKNHPLKEFFNIKNLNLKAAAMAFGFTDMPHVDFL